MMISPELISVIVTIPVLVGIRARWQQRKARKQATRRLEEVCAPTVVAPKFGRVEMGRAA